MLVSFSAFSCLVIFLACCFSLGMVKRLWVKRETNSPNLQTKMEAVGVERKERARKRAKKEKRRRNNFIFFTRDCVFQDILLFLFSFLDYVCSNTDS